MVYNKFNTKKEAQEVQNQHALDYGLRKKPEYRTLFVYDIREDIQGKWYYPDVVGVNLAMSKIPLQAQQKIEESNINWK